MQIYFHFLCVKNTQLCQNSVCLLIKIELFFGGDAKTNGSKSKKRIWCGRRDSNSHAKALASKTSVSTNFTTSANFKIEQRSIPNIF